MADAAAGTMFALLDDSLGSILLLLARIRIIGNLAECRTLMRLAGWSKITTITGNAPALKEQLSRPTFPLPGHVA